MSWENWVIYSIAATLVSGATVAASNRLYTKIGTYHKYTFTGGTEDCEHVFLKLLRLFTYNGIIALSVTGLIFVYAVFAGGPEGFIGLTEAKALMVGAIVMNFCIRVLALSKYTGNKIYERSLSFGFSFILSIYFLSFFGISTYLISNGFQITIEKVSGLTGASVIPILTIVVAGPFASTILSELILGLSGVKSDHLDAFEEDDPDLLGWGA
jgi:hypothetical protein